MALPRKSTGVRACLWLVVVLGLLHICITKADANVKRQQDEYIEYHPGTAGIIISVPHGGDLAPDSIPDRVRGCLQSDGTCLYPSNEGCPPDPVACPATTETDSFTIDLAWTVANTITELLDGEAPHLIISNLKRTKLDPNREVNEAAQNNPEAVAAHEAYHGYIEQARQAIERGIFFDLHGQSHKKNSTELGYLLTTEQLNNEYYNATETSINTLSEESGLDGRELIIGPSSMGAFLENIGYMALPSPRQHYPGSDAYFDGGYTTETHGSLNGGPVDAIMMETPSEVRIDGGQEVRDEFGRALARAMVEFYNFHYWGK